MAASAVTRELGLTLVTEECAAQLKEELAQKRAELANAG